MDKKGLLFCLRGDLYSEYSESTHAVRGYLSQKGLLLGK